jgi:lysophospholipase L1-like esterase
VKTVLCYGDSNTWGCIPLTGPEPSRRLPPDERWPGVLRHELGPDYCVIEEGLNGRTTVWEDGLEPYRNGREFLPPILLSHQPIDVVVLMLGTNDLKRRFGVSAREVAEGAAQLVDLVRASAGCGPGEAPPEVLLVCPPPLGPLDRFAEEFEGGLEKSRQLARHFHALAAERECPFLDAGVHLSSSDGDGVHLDRDAHRLLGEVVAAAVRDKWS